MGLIQSVEGHKRLKSTTGREDFLDCLWTQTSTWTLPCVSSLLWWFHQSSWQPPNHVINYLKQICLLDLLLYPTYAVCISYYISYIHLYISSIVYISFIPPIIAYIHHLPTYLLTYLSISYCFYFSEEPGPMYHQLSVNEINCLVSGIHGFPLYNFDPWADYRSTLSSLNYP